MPGIGTYCGYYTLKGFHKAEKGKWLKKMEENAVHDASEGNIKAWSNAFDVLQEAISLLPEQHQKLHIIFEYGLPHKNFTPPPSPTDPAVFADAIILSRDTAVVLEFKQADTPFIGYVRQARKYRRRIQNFPDESRGMTKRSILVLTKGRNISCRYRQVHCCSAELLAQAIIEALGGNPQQHLNVQAWCDSKFSCKPIAHTIPTLDDVDCGQ